MVERKIKKKEMERKEEGKERKVIKKGKGKESKTETAEERKERKSGSKEKVFLGVNELTVIGEVYFTFMFTALICS